MVHTLGKETLVLSFIEKGVELRGIRQLIQLNPIRFENNQEILDHLHKKLPALLEQIRNRKLEE